MQVTTVTGTTGNDVLKGSAGNDIFTPGKGHDTITGGAGVDVVELSGQAKDYTMKVINGAVTLSTLDGSSTYAMSDIESLRFTGGQGSSAEELAARLYKGVLGRSADAYEISFWADSLSNGNSLLNVAHGFVDSAEAADLFRVSGTAGYVTALYEGILGRSPDQSGLDFWVDAINKGADRAQIALDFINSPEYLAKPVTLDVNASDVAVLVRLYATMFGRAPDEAGLNYWLAQRAAGVSMSTIADGFAGSQETGNLSDTAFIDKLYETGLHRDPTAAELAAMLDSFAHGLDRGQVLLQVAESAPMVELVGVVTTTVHTTVA